MTNISSAWTVRQLMGSAYISTSNTPVVHHWCYTAVLQNRLLFLALIVLLEQPPTRAAQCSRTAGAAGGGDCNWKLDRQKGKRLTRQFSKEAAFSPPSLCAWRQKPLTKGVWLWRSPAALRVKCQGDTWSFLTCWIIREKGKEAECAQLHLSSEELHPPTHSKLEPSKGYSWGRFDPVVVKDLALPFTRKKPKTGYFLKLSWPIISAIFQIFYICGMKKWAGCDRASMEAASAFGSPVGKATIYMNCESIPVNCQNSKTQRGNKHLSERSWTN